MTAKWGIPTSGEAAEASVAGGFIEDGGHRQKRSKTWPFKEHCVSWSRTGVRRRCGTAVRKIRRSTDSPGCRPGTWWSSREKLFPCVGVQSVRVAQVGRQVALAVCHAACRRVHSTATGRWLPSFFSAAVPQYPGMSPFPVCVVLWSGPAAESGAKDNSASWTSSMVQTPRSRARKNASIFLNPNPAKCPPGETLSKMRKEGEEAAFKEENDEDFWIMGGDLRYEYGAVCFLSKFNDRSESGW